MEQVTDLSQNKPLPEWKKLEAAISLLIDHATRLGSEQDLNIIRNFEQEISEAYHLSQECIEYLVAGLITSQLPVAYHGIEVINRITEEAVKEVIEKTTEQKSALKEISEEISRFMVNHNAESSDRENIPKPETFRLLELVSERVQESYRLAKEIFILQEFQDLVSQVAERIYRKLTEIESATGEVAKLLGAEIVDTQREDITGTSIDELNTEIDAKACQLIVDDMLKNAQKAK